MERMANSSFKDNKTGGVKIGPPRSNNGVSGGSNNGKNSKNESGDCC